MIDEMIDLVRLVPDVNSCEKKQQFCIESSEFFIFGDHIFPGSMGGPSWR